MCEDKIPRKIDGGFYRYKSRGLIGHKREWKGIKGERRGIRGKKGHKGEWKGEKGRMLLQSRAPWKEGTTNSVFSPIILTTHFYHEQMS